MCAPHGRREHVARRLEAPLGNVLPEYTNALVGLVQEDRIQAVTDFNRTDPANLFAGVFRRLERSAIFARGHGPYRFARGRLRFAQLKAIAPVQLVGGEFDGFSGAAVEVFRQRGRHKISRAAPQFWRVEGSAARQFAFVFEGAAFAHPLRRAHQQSNIDHAARVAADRRDPSGHQEARGIGERNQVFRRGALLGEPEVEALFDTPRRFAKGFQADHAARAFQRVEGAPRGHESGLIIGRGTQGRELLADADQNFVRLFNKDIVQFAIGRGLTGRHRRRGLGHNGRGRGRKQRGQRAQEVGIVRIAKAHEKLSCAGGLGFQYGIVEKISLARERRQHAAKFPRQRGVRRPIREPARNSMHGDLMLLGRSLDIFGSSLDGGSGDLVDRQIDRARWRSEFIFRWRYGLCT